MNNKLDNILNKFIEETKTTNPKEINKVLQDFIKKYNEGSIDYENTPLDDAYDLLEQAKKHKVKKTAIKLAKKAYEKCPDCFEAILYLAEIEQNSIKKERILNYGLEHEKKRLQREEYFQKDSIGIFYEIYETRPYIRGLYYKALCLLNDGKYKLAKDICKEILKLNENDNTGARYLLMAIYAILEEEPPMLKLYKKYKEDTLPMLFPLMILYYKQENYHQSKKYLVKIKKANPDFIEFIKGTIKKIPYNSKECSPKETTTDILMYFENYKFFINTLPNIKDFILEN